MAPLRARDTVWRREKACLRFHRTRQAQGSGATLSCLLLCFMPPPFTPQTQWWLVYFHTPSERRLQQKACLIAPTPAESPSGE